MNLIQELMNQAHTGGLLQTEHIKRFSPGEIREAIQSLVIEGKDLVATE